MGDEAGQYDEDAGAVSASEKAQEFGSSAEPEAQPDDTEPSPERQAELRAAYEANTAAGKAPYEGVWIRTLGELRWVMHERGWTGHPRLESNEPANLSGANLFQANLSSAVLSEAKLCGSNLHHANLRGANLTGADLSGASLEDAILTGADLRWAYMDAKTDMNGAEFDSRTRVADVVWNGAPLSRLNWEQVTELGDEHVARRAKDENGKPKVRALRLREYQDAVMANRQVATVLRSQGLNEHSDRFAYSAQVLQREVLRRQRKVARWLWSWFLEILAGYGYQPIRTAGVYVGIILMFAAYYQRFAPAAHLRLSFVAAVVMSVASFHGRGFFPTPTLPLDGPLAVTGAIEALVGLIIEASFIATFTQRFFAR